MTAVARNYQLTADDRADPVVWVQSAPDECLPLIAALNLSDEAIRAILGDGKSQKLRSFGHDDLGVHFLLTRAGTPLHTDKGYTRYSHQLVLRNDGNRLRGMPHLDGDRSTWHPPLVPGTMYALDTHSPHQGLHDLRFGVRRRTALKAVLATDRDTVLTPDEVWGMVRPWLIAGVQIGDVNFDPALKAAPRWKDPGADPDQEHPVGQGAGR